MSSYAEDIKEPNVAGAFYPADPDQLAAMIKRYIGEAQQAPIEGEPLVLISPHAGYIYSGPVAAYGFKALLRHKFETVVIIAATHYFPFRGVSVYAQGLFRTPLGDLAVDSQLAAEIISHNPKMLFYEPRFFDEEHSLEVQLPFLQAAFEPGFKIIPIIVGNLTIDECEELAGYLADVLKDKPVLVVASTDLSHYKPYDEAVVYDTKTGDFIKEFDSAGLWEAVSQTGWNVCGFRPVVTAIAYAKLRGANKVEILKYANSGDTAGDKSRVVGYLSAVFVKAQDSGEQDMLTKDDKKRLLEIARSTIENHVTGKKIPAWRETSPGMNLKQGVFVTLRKQENLRGCIGLFSSSEPLYETVSKMSIESATHDYRFHPVEPAELKDISIEISVLSEPELIDDYKKIRLGIDGVIIRKGFSSGVFLPQVATETGWDLETFLGQLCFQKAGLPPDCFKDPTTQIYTFQADIFSESED